MISRLHSVYELLLAPPHIRAPVDGEITTTATTFARLSKPVPSEESSVVESVMGQPGHLSPYTDYLAKAPSENGGEQEQKDNQLPYRKANSIPSYQLHPSTQTVELLNDIGPSIWSGTTNSNDESHAWKDSFKNYQGVYTKGKYRSLILKDSIDHSFDLGIFGTEANALDPILKFVAILHDQGESVPYDVLIHSVMIICLQFYLMERNRFLEVHANKSDQFYDIYQPLIFMFMHRYDTKKDLYTVPLEDMTYENISNVASTCDFVSFFVAVMTHIRVECNRRIKLYTKERKCEFHLLEKHILTFHRDKLFSNLVLVFITSRFSYMLIHDYPTRVMGAISKIVNKQSLNAPDGKRPFMKYEQKKHFGAPQRLMFSKIVYGGQPPLNNEHDRPDVPRENAGVAIYTTLVPVLYCHSEFSCYAPAFFFPSYLEGVGDLWVPSSLKKDSSLLEKCTRWQDLVLNTLVRFIDTTLYGNCNTGLNVVYKKIVNDQQARLKKRKLIEKEKKKKKNKKKKQRKEKEEEKKEESSDDEEEDEEEEDEDKKRIHKKVREYSHEQTSLNAVRVTYSFMIVDQQGLANQLKPFVLSKRFAVDWSPWYISRQCWKWMMSRTMSSSHVELFSRGSPLLKTTEDMGEDADYNVIYFPFEERFKHLQGLYYLKVDLSIPSCSFEYVAICEYIYVSQSEQSIRSTNMFIYYYALIALLKSEPDAALRMKQELIQESGEAVGLLCGIKEGFSKVTEGVSQRFGQLCERWESLSTMYNICRNRWIAKDFYTAAIPTQEEWQNGMTQQVYIDLIKDALERAHSTWYCAVHNNSNCKIDDVIEWIAKVWACPGIEDDHSHSGHWEHCAFSSRRTGKRQFSLYGFSGYLKMLITNDLIAISLAWRFQLPGNIIPPPSLSYIHELNDLNRITPTLHKLFMTIMKTTRTNAFKAELRAVTLGASVKPVNEFVKNILSSVEFVYKFARNKLKGGTDDISAMLAAVTKDQNYANVHVNAHKKQILDYCTGLFQTNLNLFGPRIIEEMIKTVTKELCWAFTPDEIPVIIINIMNTIEATTTHKKAIRDYRENCSRALLEHNNARSDPLSHVNSAHSSEAPQSQLRITLGSLINNTPVNSLTIAAIAPPPHPTASIAILPAAPSLIPNRPASSSSSSSSGLINIGEKQLNLLRQRQERDARREEQAREKARKLVEEERRKTQ